MFKIALASHGSLCRGMRETAKLFTQDVSFIQIFPFYEENPESDVEAQLDAWIEDIHEEDVVVMLTDILWGSVNQKIMLKLQNRTNVHIVTGLNLPVLLEMITMEPQSVTPELISEKVKSCRDSIAFMREVTVEFQDGDE